MRKYCTPHLFLFLVILFSITMVLFLPNQIIAGKTSVSKEFSAEFDAGSRSHLSVETLNGSITVEGYKGEKVSIKAEIEVTGRKEKTCEKILEDVEINITEKADKIDIDVDSPSKFGYSTNVTFDIKVPDRMKIDGETANGSISVSNITSGVDLETVNGAIRCKDVTGGIDAETVNGKIKLTDVAGKIDAATVNGAISCYFNADPPTIIDFETVNGGIDATFKSLPNATIYASTYNGNISVSGASASINKRFRREFKGVLGQGEGRYDMETINGSIDIEIIE